MQSPCHSGQAVALVEQDAEAERSHKRFAIGPDPLHKVRFQGYYLWLAWWSRFTRFVATSVPSNALIGRGAGDARRHHPVAPGWEFAEVTGA